MECNITTALYLIVTKLLSKATAEQEHNVNRNIFRLNRLNVRTKDGSSLLHMAANVDTPVDEFNTSDICRCRLYVPLSVMFEYDDIFSLFIHSFSSLSLMAALSKSP